MSWQTAVKQTVLAEASLRWLFGIVADLTDQLYSLLVEVRSSPKVGYKLLLALQLLGVFLSLGLLYTALKTDVESPVLQLKPQCTVWCWGNGISTPKILPLPALDTVVTEVSCSRNQKAAVTANGAMFVWEVIFYFSILCLI